MAIKINAGTAPRYGRITMPKGTFLSTPPKFNNPATSADGGLGGGGGMNPPQPPTNWWEQEKQSNSPFTSPHALPSGEIGLTPWEKFGNFIKLNTMLEAPYTSLTGSYGQTISPTPANLLQNNPRFPLRGTYGQLLDLAPITPARITPPEIDPHPFVGASLSPSPVQLSFQQVKMLYPAMSDTEINRVMVSKGYTYTFVGGQGGMYVKTGEGTAGQEGRGTGNANVNSPGTPGTASMGEVDERGRPVFVDPTQLAPGERVTASSGLTFVGGTPTESGQAQYAMTIPGGVNDERYKWAEKTQQDQEGNWVKVYYREQRKVFSRKHRKQQRDKPSGREVMQARAAAAQEQSASVNPVVSVQQLVNLRANYG